MPSASVDRGVGALAAFAAQIALNVAWSKGATAAMVPNALSVAFATVLTGAIDYLEHGGQRIDGHRGLVSNRS